MKNEKGILLPSIFITIGLIVIGMYINTGLQSLTNRNRVITVKGLAEKNIKAKSAVININFLFTGNHPNQLMNEVNQEEDRIISLIKKQGYKGFKISNINIDDSKTYFEEQWNGERMIKVKKDRYKAYKNIEIEILEVENAANKANDIKINLINNGISSSEVSCSYVFPELNDIKPELIAESTKNARIAGEQFANDSQSKLGKIKTASQGQISIAGQYYDENGLTIAPKEPYLQKVRVVSTIIFFLED